MSNPVAKDEDKKIWLLKDQKEYDAKNLDPGEMYEVQLKSMTSNEVGCLEKKKEMFITKPLPPDKVT